eukprot:135584-Ditylum_brightwellii.AAC.1
MLWTKFNSSLSYENVHTASRKFFHDASEHKSSSKTRIAFGNGLKLSKRNNEETFATLVELAVGED